jgi:hypothetical protein
MITRACSGQLYGRIERTEEAVFHDDARVREGYDRSEGSG